jgi:dihydroceramidase
MPAISQHEGYWGEVTASIDWCESNYEYSFYIAEMSNTLSSIAIILAGLFGLLLHKCTPRFAVAFGCIIVVGLGSVAFHATLKKESQWTDEVPMLYSAMSFSFIAICQRFKSLTPLHTRLIASAFTIYAVITTLLVTLTEGDWQFRLFHLSFSVIELYAIGQVVLIMKTYNRNSPIFILGSCGFISYVLGVVVWSIDLFNCHALTKFNPQFHAWWHFFVR